jgi:CHAT domain-containing protein
MPPTSRFTVIASLSLWIPGLILTPSAQAMRSTQTSQSVKSPILIAQEFPDGPPPNDFPAETPPNDLPTDFPTETPPLEPLPENNLPPLSQTDPPPVFRPTIPAQPQIPANLPDCVADCPLSLPPINSRPGLNLRNPRFTPLLVIDPRVRGGVFQDIALQETRYADEFTTYLGLNSQAFPKPEISETQEILGLVAEATGIKPAIIYVAFVPPSAESLGASDLTHNKSFATEPGNLTQRPDQPEDLLELIVVTPSGPPIRRTVSATRAQVLRVAGQLRSEVTNRSRTRSQTYLPPAQQLYGWLVEPLEDILTEAEIGNLAFVMAPGLRSLPVATLHDGEQFLIERYSVGLMPSINLTDLRYVDVRNTEVLAMGASNFTDQPELPAVPLELSTIADQLWPGDFLINETFTPDVLIASRQQKPYGIVHLATHGEFKSGSVDNSYIQFWDRRLGIDQVRALRLNHPPVELMVLSACRTALGNEEAELGFAGLAVQAGVKTALASLWKVDDVGTAGLMTQFYASLRQEPIKAEALRQAQLAMLKGEIQIQGNRLLWAGGEIVLPPNLSQVSRTEFSHPFFWAAFTVIGSPW